LRVQADESVTCQDFQRYVLVERPIQDGVGTDFLIKNRKGVKRPGRCVYSKDKGDFEIKNEFAEYFAGFQGDLLILDSGTGPDRGLIIWNVRSRKKVYSAQYSEPLEIQTNRIEFWTEAGKADNENCPLLKEWEVQGLEAALETRVTLRLPDLQVISKSGTRCSPRQ
jgi:hypothetical protein